MPIVPSAVPTAAPSQPLDGLARHYGMQAVATGRSVSLDRWDRYGEIQVLGATSHYSWVYFNETFSYPFVIKFVEHRNTATATTPVHLGWHWDPRNVDQYTSYLHLNPSGYAFMTSGFGTYPGSYDGIGDITPDELVLKTSVLTRTEKLYGVVPITEKNNILVVNWTSLAWSQNATHLNMAGYVSGINPTYWLLGLSVTGLDASGLWLGNARVARTWNNDYNELYVSGVLASEHVNQSQFMTRASLSGVEASVDISMFPSSVLSFDMDLYVLGYTAALGWQGGGVKFTVDRANCPASMTSSVVWKEDGDPTDFASSHAVFKIHNSAPLSREWAVEVHRNLSHVYLNNVLRATIPTPLSTNSRRPLGVAGLRIGANSLADSSSTITNVSFYGSTSRHDSTATTIKIMQHDLPYDSVRGPRITFVTPVGPDVRGLPCDSDVHLVLGPLYQAVEGLYNHTFDIDPLIVAWSDVAGGVNSGTSGVFVPDWGMGMIMVTYHEMSHWTGCVGGGCDYSSNMWMWEGHASYMGQQARNKALGLPAFTFYPGLWFPTDFVPNGPNDQPLVSVNNGLQYYKSEMFLYLLSEVIGYDVMMSVISNNHNKIVSTAGFIASLEAASGKDLSAWLPGWLYAGTYNSSLITAGALYRDTDGDGLADFQEVLRGTNYSLADTDGDGYSDFWELAHDYDPTISLSKPAAGSSVGWVVDGLPHDFPHNVSDALWFYAGSTPYRTQSVKCKRIDDTDTIHCAIWNFPNATGTIRRMFAGYQGGASLQVSCVGSNPYYGLQVTMDGWGGIHYVYNDLGRPDLKIPVSTWSFRETDVGAEFILTLPGRDLWLYFYYGDSSDGFYHLDIHIPN